MHTHNEIEYLSDGKCKYRSGEHDQRSSFAENPEDDKAFEETECDKTDERKEEIEYIEREIFRAGWYCVEGCSPSEPGVGSDEAYADDECKRGEKDELRLD